MSKPTTKCRACNGTGQAPLTRTYSDVLRMFQLSTKLSSAYVAQYLRINHDNACKRLDVLERLGFVTAHKEKGVRGRLFSRTKRSRTGGRAK